MVTIMEKKVVCDSERDLHLRLQMCTGLCSKFVCLCSTQTLSLTCTVCGDPKPQVSWLKNGADVEPDDQVSSSLIVGDDWGSEYFSNLVFSAH